MLLYHHGNDTTKSEKAKDKEKPEEPLGVASQINAIVFLIAFVELPAFVGKHSMNFLQVALHLDQYLFVVLVKLLKLLEDKEAIVETLSAENGGYPPTQNGDIRSLFWLFSLMALQN